MTDLSDLPLRLETVQASLHFSGHSKSPRSPKSPLSLDLSDLPTLISPSPPSNTLLITKLTDPIIFQPENLQTIRNLINQRVTIYSWSPLKSLRRIIVTFYDVKDATMIKQTLDDEIIFDCRVKIYFGADTDISLTIEDRLLRAPKLDKQFFISPPPSPPHGWEMRNEEPPNKEVHADDLAHALSRLHARAGARGPPPMDALMENDDDNDGNSGSSLGGGGGGAVVDGRNRSGSTTVVYHPNDHGDNPALPAISVEDTTELCESPVPASPMEGVIAAPILHTARPPVELMDHSNNP